MATYEFELTPTCKFVLAQDLTLEYIEHATDYWSCNSDTCVTITEEDALEIMKIINKAYPEVVWKLPLEEEQ